MLKLAPQFEQCWKPKTSSDQAFAAEIAAAWGRNGRPVTVGGRNRGQAGGRDIHESEVLVETRAAKWERAVVVHRSWRVKRPCTWPKQAARGALRERVVLMPVSYTTTSPVLDTEERGPGETVVGDKQRLLNALVASAPLMVSGDKDDSPMQNVSLEESGASGNRSEGVSRDTKAVNGRKVEWRPPMESVRVSREMERKSEDWSTNASHLRQLEEKILLLESVDVDTAKVMLTCPSATSVSVEDLKAIIYYLESCRLKRGDLGRILSMTPQILVCSVEKQLRPAVRFLLKEVGLSKADLRKVINRCPRLLVASVDSQLRPTMHFLQGLGFLRMASLVCNNATLLTFSIQSKLLPKLNFLQSLGFARDEAVSLVLRFPAIFNYGVEQNLRPKFDYFVEVMGGDLNQLKAFPQYFGYSLSKRIQPRYEFMRQRNLRIQLSILLKISDEEFCSRFKAARVMEGAFERELAALRNPLSKDSMDNSAMADVLESPTDSGGEGPALLHVKESGAAASCELLPARVGA